MNIKIAKLKKTKKIVISGSAYLQKEMHWWRYFWNNRKNHSVIDFPHSIKNKNFIKDYPRIHKKFFLNIAKSNVLFVANESKNGIKGYIGAEVFSELAFGVMQNLLNNRKIEIILAQMPSSQVQSFEEIKLWLKLGWIKIWNRSRIIS